MDYKEMLMQAKKKGLTNENKMWQSVSAIGEGLDMLKESHPDIYWNMMRKQHCILYDGHYSEEFAKHDIDKMHSVDKSGVKHSGAHWTKDEIVAATSNRTFPNGVTDCDKYVAYNAMWHDMNKKFDDAQVLDIAYLFFFADEDWHEPSRKIWEYMQANNE